MMNWQKPFYKRRGLVGLLLCLSAAGLIWFLVPSSPQDEKFKSDQPGGDVLQGVIPGLGPMILSLEPGQKTSGSAFCQKDGNWYHLDGNDKQGPGLVRVSLISDYYDVTNGALSLSWVARPAPFIEGNWVSANDEPAARVKFQRVAQKYSRARFCRLGVPSLSARLTEWTSFPVFPENWRLSQISRELRQNWWQPEWHFSHLFFGPLSLVKYAFNPGAFESLELARDAQVLFVSDKLVSVFTVAGTDVMLASATRREMWNYCIADGRAKRFGLADLFRPGARWEERLSSLCLQGLKALPEQANLEKLSASAMAEFAVLPAGLMIQFDPYRFGVGSDNDFHVMIPWSQIQDVLDPNGPASLLGGKTAK